MKKLIHILLQSIIIIDLVINLANGKMTTITTSLLISLLLLIPVLLKKLVFIPTYLEITFKLFIFASIYLGQLKGFYTLFPWWDNFLHTSSGIITTAIGLSLITLKNKNINVKIFSLVSICIVAFCFSMTTGVIWEFMEYGVDSFYNKDSQKDTIVKTIKTTALNPDNHFEVVNIDKVVINDKIVLDGYLDIGLIDTMTDLLVNFIGSIGFIIFICIFQRKNFEVWLITSNKKEIL